MCQISVDDVGKFQLRLQIYERRPVHISDADKRKRCRDLLTFKLVWNGAKCPI